jgi:hypothetical protein
MIHIMPMYRKRTILLIILLALASNLFACSTERYEQLLLAKTDPGNELRSQEQFESYLTEFLISVFLTDPFYIHSSMQSPEELGIESDYPRTWNDPYRYPTEEELATDKAFIAHI